jgi:signal transduction histidine kinase
VSLLLPFRSLRANLIAAFAAVIAVSLLLACAAFAYIVRDYQTSREKQQLESLAIPAAGIVSRLVLQDQPLSTIEARVDEFAGEANVRVLLISDDGVVVHDTDSRDLVGRSFAIPPGVTISLGRRVINIFEGTLYTGDADPLYAVVVSNPALKVALVQPETSLSSTWRELLPRLAIAALSALVISVALAWRLAGSITRPLVQITRASEELARGNYEHQLNVPEAPNEVRRLATAFTVMASEVARSQRAMRDLLANVSHDLRTPLTSIQGFAGALVDGTLVGPEGAREAGRVIGEEAERMRRLVEDLLYLGRIESGELALERKPLDLAEVARATQQRFGFRADESGIRFSIVAHEEVPILGDSHRLAQVLDNLLENAFKHTPTGGAITVTARVEDSTPAQRNGRVMPDGSRTAARSTVRYGILSVHNTGSVIPDDEIERVFERFYQLDKARVGKAGRGLGLSIAREIVQGHGGTLEVESSAAEGTAFSARLPLVETPTRTALSSAPETGRTPVAAAARR